MRCSTHVSGDFDRHERSQPVSGKAMSIAAAREACHPPLASHCKPQASMDYRKYNYVGTFIGSSQALRSSARGLCAALRAALRGSACGLWALCGSERGLCGSTRGSARQRARGCAAGLCACVAPRAAPRSGRSPPPSKIMNTYSLS